MASVLRKMGLLVLVCAMAFTSSIVSADSSKSKDTSQKKTYIHLTKEEAQEFEALNGGKANDETIAGGIIAYNGVLTDDQVKNYKQELLKPRDEAVNKSKEKDKDVQALWCTGDYLSNIQNQGSGWYFPSSPLQGATGWGVIILHVSVSADVSATFSANYGVSAGVVEAGVGYSFSATWGVSSEGEWTVPSGQYGTLQAFALFEKKTWDVWDDDCGTPEDTYKGAGSSYKPTTSTYYRHTVQ